MTVKQELIALVLLVLLVDAFFIAIYFLLNLRLGSDASKLTFTVLWTLLTLLVVIRGLGRIRLARLRRPRPGGE